MVRPREMRAHLALAAVAALALAAVPGCSAVLDFDECNRDEECAGRVDGGAGYCTSDHLCVAEIPSERLCTSGTVPENPPAGATWIGGFFRLSGNSGDKDTEMANAARLAIEQLGVAMSRPIAMVLCDTAGGSDVAVRSVDKAVREHNIVALVGPTTSGSFLGVVPSLVQHGLLAVSPSATSPAITNVQDNGLAWRTCASDDLQATKLAQLLPLMTMSRPTTVNVAYVNSAYGSGLNTAFVAEWSRRSGGTPLSARPFAEGEDPTMIVSRLANDRPDYSLIVADSDATAIMNALYSAPSGLSATQFLFTDGAKGPNLFGPSPNLAVLSRVRGTAPANPAPTDPVFATFRLAYTDRFATDPTTTSFVANTYDATFAVALAIAAGSEAHPSGAVLAERMARMSDPAGTRVEVKPATDFTKGASALAAGGRIDLVGASGPLTWDATTGDLTEAPIEVWGVRTTVTPPQYCVLPTGALPCP
jgi:branched-chain amino acid transport system substrate-binding protein